MRTRQLGKDGPIVSALGLGCMGMSGVYGPVAEAESIRTIHAALDAGINLLDTGDFYGMGHNEMLLRQALQGERRQRAFLSVKFGAQRDPKGAFLGFDGRPQAVKSFIAYSLRRLGTDYLDLYQPARVDPQVPIEDTIGAVADLVREGYVRHVGISEASAATVRRAHAVHPIAALQIEYSLFSRGVEAEILPTLRQLGISLVAYGIYGRGLVGARAAAGQPRAAGDSRGGFPRFQGANFERNLQLVAALEDVARQHGVPAGRLALAWVSSRGADVVPLAGARNHQQLTDALAAADLELTAADLAAIESAVPAGAVSGDRYPAPAMASLDGQRT